MFAAFWIMMRKNLACKFTELKVIGRLDDLDTKIFELNIKQVIIAMPSAPKELIRTLTPTTNPFKYIIQNCSSHKRYD